MMKSFLKITSLLLVTILLVAGATLYYQYQRFIKTPVNISQAAPAFFEVKQGSNIRQIARQLREAGILDSSPLLPSDLLLRAEARLTDKAHRIKAGEYELTAGMTPGDVLDKLVSGKTVQYQIGIIEGRSFKELVQTVRDNPHLQQTLSDADYRDLMAKLDAPSGMQAEGWFFPDTYNFPRGTTDMDVLKRSYTQMNDYLLKAWEQRVPHPNIKTPYEALILASIIEKETGVPDERPLIARIFLNRLEKGMMLQTDPTVIYGMGDAYAGNIRKKDLRTDTPYNSYTRTGLPPTPIAIPSKAAIDAVFHPAESKNLYFVATGQGDGRHYFSDTYDEHRKAVIQYQLNGRSSAYQGDN